MKPDTPVSELRGAGPKRVLALRRLGIETVKDLQGHYPMRVGFAPPLYNYSINGRPAPEEAITYVGDVASINRRGYTDRDFGISFWSGLTVKWFNGRRLCNQIFKGSRVVVSGTVSDSRFTNPVFKVLKTGEEPNLADLRVVTYPVTNGITSKDISRFVKQTLHLADDTVRALHNPKDPAEYDAAVKAEKYRELFYMQLALAVRKQRRESEPTNVRCMIPPDEQFSRYFPFDLTVDQYAAIRDVQRDMCKPGSMNRLLQGDVSSGKTCVAAYAAMLMACNSGQTAILCPTQVLAEQHYRSIRGFFDAAGLCCRLVVGANKNDPVHTSRTADVVIGTTALLSDDESFSYLGLVVVDEQHKFGVEQRAALRKHGNPHILLMSATPIPRTIAMTAFGDLDVSVIKTMPPGRLPVKTLWCRTNEQEGVASNYVAGELRQGHQVYVVCPRIEALDDEMRAVEEVMFEYRDRFPGVPISCIHGRLHRADKHHAIDWWGTPDPRGKILVATTVIEVGVDNPNATVMVVAGAERFGLATLWQLHGRVGRSDKQSYCFLLSDTESAEGRARLKAMEKATDGFQIAEMDLSLRGPGSLLSTEQHGLPNLKIADMVEDFDLMVEARGDAQLVASYSSGHCSYRKHMKELNARYGDVLHLGDVG